MRECLSTHTAPHKAALSGEKDPKPPANETQDLKNSLLVVAVKKIFSQRRIKITTAMHKAVMNSCCTALSIIANNGAREQKALISRRQREPSHIGCSWLQLPQHVEHGENRSLVFQKAQHDLIQLPCMLGFLTMFHLWSEEHSSKLPT